MKKLISILSIILILFISLPTINAENSTSHFILIYMDQNYKKGDFFEMSKSGITNFVILSLDDFDNNQDNYLNKLIPRTLFTMLRITQEVPNANLWIATPHMNSMTHPYYFSTALEKIYNYLLEIQKSMPIIWRNNIKGIYMNTETIIGQVDYNNLYANFTISFMNDLAFRIHEYLDKKVLWIPYYGYGDHAARIIKNLGYIVNTTPIFDYVLIQPHYYFDGDNIKNLDGVFYSVINQEICYRDKKIVTPRTSNSKSKIGFLIEISSAIKWENAEVYQSRYNQYRFNFIGLRNIFPSGFYSGGANDVDYKRIHDFYINNRNNEQLFDILSNNMLYIMY